MHWGRAPPRRRDADASSALDDPPCRRAASTPCPPLSLLPERSRGWSAYGGLDAHRDDGRDWAPRLRPHRRRARRRVVQLDGVATPRAGITVGVRVTLDEHGVVTRRRRRDQRRRHRPARRLARARAARAGARRRRAHAGGPLGQGDAAAAHPARARRRWCSRTGAVARRTSRRPPCSSARTAFGEQSGEVWAAHLAWSGNHHLRAEAPARRSTVPVPRRAAAARRGAPRSRASRTAPRWWLAAYSATGLGGVSDAFHAHVRARRRATRATPRRCCSTRGRRSTSATTSPELRRLADVAASVGVERFVLDDGWFRGRDDDTTLARRLVRRRARSTPTASACSSTT